MNPSFNQWVAHLSILNVTGIAESKRINVSFTDTESLIQKPRTFLFLTDGLCYSFKCSPLSVEAKSDSCVRPRCEAYSMLSPVPEFVRDSQGVCNLLPVSEFSASAGSCESSRIESVWSLTENSFSDTILTFSDKNISHVCYRSVIVMITA